MLLEILSYHRTVRMIPHSIFCTDGYPSLSTSCWTLRNMNITSRLFLRYGFLCSLRLCHSTRPPRWQGSTGATTVLAASKAPHFLSVFVTDLTAIRQKHWSTARPQSSLVCGQCWPSCVFISVVGGGGNKCEQKHLTRKWWRSELTTLTSCILWRIQNGVVNIGCHCLVNIRTLGYCLVYGFSHSHLMTIYLSGCKPLRSAAGVSNTLRGQWRWSTVESL